LTCVLGRPLGFRSTQRSVASDSELIRSRPAGEQESRMSPFSCPAGEQESRMSPFSCPPFFLSGIEMMNMDWGCAWLSPCAPAPRTFQRVIRISHLVSREESDEIRFPLRPGLRGTSQSQQRRLVTSNGSSREASGCGVPCGRSAGIRRAWLSGWDSGETSSRTQPRCSQPDRRDEGPA